MAQACEHAGFATKGVFAHERENPRQQRRRLQRAAHFAHRLLVVAQHQQQRRQMARLQRLRPLAAAPAAGLGAAHGGRGAT